MDTNTEEYVSENRCWIRRHKILAILAPFFILILFFTLWVGILEARTPKSYGSDPGPLGRFFSGTMDGFVFTLFSWLIFIEEWSRMFEHRWLAYPLYAIPAIVFLVSRTNRSAIVSYVVFCLLVGAASYTGFGLICRLME